MSGTTTKSGQVDNTEPNRRSPERIAEIHAILTRAQQGDASVIPQLRGLLDDDPSIWVSLGDVAAVARVKWIDLISGTNYLMRESLIRDCYAQIVELVGKDASPLAKLLAERVVMCRMQLAHAEGTLAQADTSLSPAVTATLDKRITACQKRLSTAIKDLTLHQKLIGRVASPASSSHETAEALATVELPVGSPDPVIANEQVVAGPLLDSSEEAVNDRIAQEFHAMRAAEAESPRNGPDIPRNGFHNRISGLVDPAHRES